MKKLTPSLDNRLIYAQKSAAFNKIYQKYLFYQDHAVKPTKLIHEILTKNQKKIQAFDLDKVRNSPACLKLYADSILPLLQFLNEHMHVRHNKTPNLLAPRSGAHNPNAGLPSFLDFLAEVAPVYTWPSLGNQKMYKNDVFEFITYQDFFNGELRRP